MMVVMRYISVPVRMSPRWEIGMMIFLVIGWHTNIAAEIVPTQLKPFSSTSGKHFTKQYVPMHIRKGTKIHVMNIVLK